MREPRHTARAGSAPSVAATALWRRPAAPACMVASSAPGPPLRHVYAVSDVHSDYAANLQWVERLAASEFGNDILLVAGDVADTSECFERTMELFTQRFGLVFFTPGNHDLWTRRDGTEGSDSLAKLERIERLCDRLGVLTTPQHVQLRRGAVSVCPLLSFYHESFDAEPGIEMLRLPSVSRVMADYRACRWPSPLETGSIELAARVDELNEAAPSKASAQAARSARRAALTPIDDWGAARRVDAPLVSFSHFLPRIELCPEKRFLVYPDLMKAVGSQPLGSRVALLRPDVHVFGHTHFGWDATLDGVRYIQAALGTPAERDRRMRSLQIGKIQRAPLRVYDGDRGRFCAQRHAAWSDYYRSHPRTPEQVTPAPWVLGHYEARAPHRVRRGEE